MGLDAIDVNDKFLGNLGQRGHIIALVQSIPHRRTRLQPSKQSS